MYIKEFFQLDEHYEDNIRKGTPNFGYDGFGEFVYYRTYSRRKPRNYEEMLLPETNNTGQLNWTGQENWADTVVRVINGTFSIRKDWYLKNNVHWDEDYWQKYALGFGQYMFKMYWLPPGRGLWAMGTDFVVKRGSMALNNCGFTDLGDDTRLGVDYEWMMDALMLGVGVGFHANDKLKCRIPTKDYIYEIADTRESWARATRLLIDGYLTNSGLPKLQYKHIRRAGLPIKGFGGLSSGPEPLIRLHMQIKICFSRFLNKPLDSATIVAEIEKHANDGYDVRQYLDSLLRLNLGLVTKREYTVVQLKTDIANMIGCCVVAGNVRRSAELAMGSVSDNVFLNLKDYSMYPERTEFGWMSNNTAYAESDSDFERMGDIARRVPLRGEPGAANIRNFAKGRLGKNDTVKPDKARGLNPCAEIQLEDKELCNVDETAPTRCPSKKIWLKACEYATFYCSTVSLLPTHWACTNNVIARNRRIGVGIVDYTGWVQRDGLFKVTSALEEGYQIVTRTNQHYNAEAGVPEAIRKTTIKPGGTVPKLMGRTSGAGYPTFKYMIRRARVAKNHPMVKLCEDANLPCEPDVFDPNTLIFSFPVESKGAKEAEQTSIWEQAYNLVHLQRWWADNSVSNTIYFKPKWLLRLVCNTDEELLMKLERGQSKLRRFLHKVLNTHEHIELESIKTLLVNGGENDKWKITKAQGVVSLYQYNPKHEEDDIENVLANIMPNIKCCSFLPHTPNGVYKQMPEEGITYEQYLEMKKNILPIDWTTFSGSDGEMDKYCQGGVCERPI